MKLSVQYVREIIKEEVNKLLRERGYTPSLSDYFNAGGMDDDFTDSDAKTLLDIISRLKSQDLTDAELDALNTLREIVYAIQSDSTNEDELDNSESEPMQLAAGKINEEEDDDEKEVVLIKKPPIRWATYKSITIREIGIYMYLTTKAIKTADELADFPFKRDVLINVFKIAIVMARRFKDDAMEYEKQLKSYLKTHPNDEEMTKEHLEAKANVEKMFIEFRRAIRNEPEWTGGLIAKNIPGIPK